MPGAQDDLPPIPLVKPAVKLKQYAWTKLPKAKLQNTFWTKANYLQLDPKINAAIEAQFAAKVTATVQTNHMVSGMYAG